jgi:phytoene synthase
MAELEISPLVRLLSAYAGKDAARHRLLWALDARLADIIRTTSEPLIGQMRLTWWHEVLTDETMTKGSGDPLVDAWREAGPFPNESYLAMIDGWEELLGMETADETALRTYAEGRGGGLFMAQTGAPPETKPMLTAAGAAWALWDLSGHISDSATAFRAIAMAKHYLPAASSGPWHRDWKASRIAFGLARQDIVKGRRAPASLTPGLYARLLRIALVGR